MGKNFSVSYTKKWSWGWGAFLLLAAALVLANQFGGFADIGIGSLIVAALAIAFMVQSIASLTFASLPIPLAALYYVFQKPLEPYGFPEISFWPLALVTLLATAGLHALIPRRRFKKHSNINVVYTGDFDNADTSADIEVDGVKIHKLNKDDAEKIIEDGDENNPRISVSFGSISRYLHANALETAELDCSFGALEIYFDNVTLSQNGAEVIANCKFGAIEMYVPSEWQIIDNINASLGGVDVKGRNKAYAEDAPKLKISGNVSLGGMEIHRV
ncbi:MAG: hypothetical protein FWD44_07055 [Oscillospiraceae bacterium]|nr:hypothetical protein [Oscillospiraceae bacterium]